MARPQPLPGNPWWSEPGWTLDRLRKDPEGETVGRHRADVVPPAPAVVAEPQPKHRAEPDGVAPAPVQTAVVRATMADLASASRAPSFEAWVASRLATDQAPGEAGKAHLTAALRRAFAAWRGVAREDAQPVLGQALGSVAEGTDAVGPLHGAGRDADPGGREVLPDPDRGVGRVVPVDQFTTTSTKGTDPDE